MPRRRADRPLDHPIAFNPLDKERLARSVTEELLISPLHPLPPKERFLGAGVYALYYLGESPIYRMLLDRQATEPELIPIYVGKAIPSGGRKGDVELNAAASSSLYSRLAHHAKSVRQAANLNIDHFNCRYLVVDDVWIPLAETLLIRRFRPLWNVVVEGFGNNPTGGPRKGQALSAWDTLHPGRSGVGHANEESKRREEKLRSKIESHLT